MKKIFHIASFEGNIGDLWSHKGLYSGILSSKFDNVEIEQIEIRKLYNNYTGKDKFNLFDQISSINSSDMLIIGGGNFFELKWTYSVNGTTLDFDLELLSRIKIPIIFLSIGFDKYKYHKNDLNAKFLNWFEGVLLLENVQILLRNDGSIKQLQKLFPNLAESKVIHGMDNAFLIPKSKISKQKTLGINIVQDMAEIRFVSAEQEEDFLKAVAKVVVDHIRSDYKIVFCPHIYSDLMAIYNVLDKLPVEYRRSKKIQVAPLDSTQQGADNLWNLYGGFEKTLTMRFHATIASIVNDCKILPISSYLKIKDLMAELSIDDYHLSVEDFIKAVNDNSDSLGMFFRLDGNDTILLDSAVNQYHMDLDSIL